MRTYFHRGESCVLVLRGKVHGGRGRSGAVRAASRAGVVLRATPAQTDTRVTDGITLHLIDGHLGRMALDELDETASLTRRDLDIGNLAKSLEEGAQLILGHISGETADEDGRVVGVSELVHWLRGTVETHGRGTHGGVHASRAGHAHGARNNTRTLVLGSGSGDTHRAVAAVDPLHLAERTLLVVLVGETDEPVATRHAADGISHDLCGFARGETALEE